MADPKLALLHSAALETCDDEHLLLILLVRSSDETSDRAGYCSQNVGAARPARAAIAEKTASPTFG